MKKISKDNKGVSILLVIIVVAIVAVAAVGAYFILAGDNDNNDNKSNETTVTVNFFVSGIINTGETIDIYIDGEKVKTISGVSGVLTNSPSGSEQYKFTGESKEVTVSAKLMKSNGTDVIQTTSTKVTVSSGTASYNANIVFNYTDLKITVSATLATDATLKVYVGTYLAATLEYISPNVMDFPVINVGKIALSDDQTTVTVRVVAIDSNDFEKNFDPVTKAIVVNGTTNVSVTVS